MRPNQKVLSLVPEGGEHIVHGDRRVIFPGLTLEILTTRLIELSVWNLRGLNDPFWRLYLPQEGKARISIATDSGVSETVLVPGQAYLVAPHSTMHTEIEGPFSKWYVHFSLGQRGDRAVPGLYPVKFTRSMRRSLARIASLTEDASHSPWSASVLVGAALEQLPPSIWTRRNVDSRVEAAMDFMHHNLGRKIGSDEIARAAKVSVRNLNHLFKMHLGVSPRTVLIDFRLSQACRMLRHTGLSIEQIAEECGFPNRYYFSRIMKQARSISPAAYRQTGYTSERG